MQYLGIATEVVPSSRIYPSEGLKGQARILDICRREQAQIYVNLPGGRELYDAAAFAREGVALHFLQPEQPGISLRSGIGDGVVLSILDAMMHNPKNTLAEAVGLYELQAA
jgi:hypothetical protein